MARPRRRLINIAGATVDGVRRPDDVEPRTKAAILKRLGTGFRPDDEAAEPESRLTSSVPRLHDQPGELEHLTLHQQATPARSSAASESSRPPVTTAGDAAARSRRSLRDPRASLSSRSSRH